MVHKEGDNSAIWFRQTTQRVYLFRGLILCAKGSITSYKGELAPIWGNEQNKSGGFTDYTSQLTHILKLNIENFSPSNYAATCCSFSACKMRNKEILPTPLIS